jgi:polyisoprenoid-binding protein YceI
MRYRFAGLAFGALASLVVFGAVPTWAAETYTVDNVHSSVSFKASHVGISWVHGRFDEVAGSFTIDSGDPSKCSFTLSMKVDSIDTNNKDRDKHLKSPDFFNAQQFPTIGFQSTSVKPVEGGYQVTGDLTMHGVKKPITFTLKGGKVVQFPPGKNRTGFTTDLILKRSDFDMGKMLSAVGDEVPVSIGIEGVKN